MQTTLKLLRPAGLALLMALLAACGDRLGDLTEVDATRQRASYALPLIDSRVSLDEIVGEGPGGVSLTVDADGLLRFRYGGEVPAVGSDVIFARLDELSNGLLFFLEDVRTPFPFGQPGELDLDFFRIRSGSLFLAVTNSAPEPVTAVFTIPEATRNGQPLRRTAELSAYSGSGPFPTLTHGAEPVDLADYDLNITGDSLYIEAFLLTAGGDTLPPGATSAIDISGLRFSRVEGFLGRELYPGVRDTIAVDFFDRNLRGEVDFLDPSITITVENSFGVPARAVIAELSVVTATGDTLPVTGPEIERGFDFAVPTEIGGRATTRFVFDRSNSNLPELLSARPAQLIYEIGALINPDNDTARPGFLTDSSFYRARLELEVPLLGSARGFTVTDTFPLGISDDYADVTAATFRLTSYNELPLDVLLTGQFTDSLGNELATLSEEDIRLLRSSPNGSAARSSQDVELTGDRLAALRRADRLVTTLTLATDGDGDGPVRITADQELHLLLGALLTVIRN